MKLRKMAERVVGPGLVRFTWLLWDVWLSFLIYPISALFKSHPSPLRVTIVLTAAAVFAAIYGWNVWSNLRRITRGQQTSGSPWPVITVLVAIALALTLFDRQEWIELFIYVSVSFAPALSARNAVRAVGAVVVLMVVLGLAIGGGIGAVLQIALQGAVSGVAVIVVVRTVVMNLELQHARAEIARLAVSEERLRFARDLHDLLGHSLSLIALKSELAARLATGSPRAAAEMRDIEQAARAALQEVREAVAGYRQPTLASELQGAGEILTAAGIRFDYKGETVVLPAAQEAALSWVVREGVTNVIKHSKARHCTIRIRAEAGRIECEVIDDGPGPSTPGAGSGLPGLAERVEALGGQCEAGRIQGGFRLAVSLPADRGSRNADAEVAVARPA
ncbi:MAG: sensor histidine kinase [Chloroflexota bacterium]|nr:sensor histidine kinase [Chloroflexota bacterium]